MSQSCFHEANAALGGRPQSGHLRHCRCLGHNAMRKSVLWVWALAAAPAFAQLPPDAGRWVSRTGNPWSVRRLPAVDMRNSPRLDGLMRAGNIYLSLADAIALALENNLDVELQRFGPAIAETELLRARGGGVIRGIPLAVGLPPQGLGGPASPLLTSTQPSVGGAGTVPTNVLNFGALTPVQQNLGIGLPAPLAIGPPVPQYDTTLPAQIQWLHETTPQSTIFLTGTNALVIQGTTAGAGVIQGFSTGTLIDFNFNANRQTTNSLRTSINPFTASNVGLTITQPLLQGFGIALNRRFIRIANNERRISGLVFRQQAIETVAGVMRIYFDFVALLEDVNVRRQAVALAEKLYADNELQVKAGTLAPIELVRARAQIAASRQDLVNAEGFAREQELVLKTVISRTGTALPEIRQARIIPTDPIPSPPATPEIRPIQDLIAEALGNRADLDAASLELLNAGIGLEGARNLALPTLNVVGILRNSGLAGQLNPNAVLTGIEFIPPPPYFLGGFGSSFLQLLRRNFPTYGVGLQLSLPLRNRVAQAEAIRSELEVRQAQVRRQQLENLIRLEVEDAAIAVERSRAAYEAAVLTRQLQEQSLAAEQKRFAVGLSTTFLVIQYQNFLAQARSTEVAARGAWAKARAALDRAVGVTLEANGISVEDAFRGRIP
jgi:outer membrane protein